MHGPLLFNLSFVGTYNYIISHNYIREVKNKNQYLSLDEMTPAFLTRKFSFTSWTKQNCTFSMTTTNLISIYQSMEYAHHGCKCLVLKLGHCWKTFWTQLYIHSLVIKYYQTTGRHYELTSLKGKSPLFVNANPLLRLKLLIKCK